MYQDIIVWPVILLVGMSAAVMLLLDGLLSNEGANRSLLSVFVGGALYLGVIMVATVLYILWIALPMLGIPLLYILYLGLETCRDIVWQWRVTREN